MPLLGRYKTLQSSSTPTTAASQQKSNSSSQQAQRMQVCESPMFGTRRQLPLSSNCQSGSTEANNAGATSQNNNKTLVASSSKNNSNEISELSSIPQQITRQQIHYAFSIIDINKDGMIDLRDLSQMLANLGVPIDEAILSHIMSTVSKRGDPRISETEFLDWLALFIEISEAPAATTPGAQAADRRRRQQQAPPKTPVSRASTTGSSLAAQQTQLPSRNRRGSGSGLALMRSLSASAGSSGQTNNQSSSVAQESVKRAGNKAEEQEQQGDSEARNDLKAAFCVFDLDGDGFITIDEVRAGLKLLGESWSPGELRQVFTKCSNSNPADLARQRISIDDFVQLLL